MGAGRGSTEVSGLPRVDTGGPRLALAIVQRRQMQIIASLHLRPTVRVEEPHPTSDPVAQNTVDQKE